jgi:hypothetical protein
MEAAIELLKQLFPDIKIIHAIGSINNFTIQYTSDGYAYCYSYMNGRTILNMRASR